MLVDERVGVRDAVRELLGVLVDDDVLEGVGDGTGVGVALGTFCAHLPELSFLLSPDT